MTSFVALETIGTKELYEGPLNSIPLMLGWLMLGWLFSLFWLLFILGLLSLHTTTTHCKEETRVNVRTSRHRDYGHCQPTRTYQLNTERKNKLRHDDQGGFPSVGQSLRFMTMFSASISLPNHQRNMNNTIMCGQHARERDLIL